MNQAVALLLLPPVLAAQEISIEAARAWGQNDDITVVTVGRDG